MTQNRGANSGKLEGIIKWYSKSLEQASTVPGGTNLVVGSNLCGREASCNLCSHFWSNLLLCNTMDWSPAWATKSPIHPAWKNVVKPKSGCCQATKIQGRSPYQICHIRLEVDKSGCWHRLKIFHCKRSQHSHALTITPLQIIGPSENWAGRKNWLQGSVVGLEYRNTQIQLRNTLRNTQGAQELAAKHQGWITVQK